MRTAPKTDAKPKRSELRKFVNALVLLSMLSVAAVCLFEGWRQTTISSAQDELDEAIASVDKSYRHGQPTIQYFNSRGQGMNGWTAFKHALDSIPSVDRDKPVAALLQMTEWQTARNAKRGWRPGFPEDSDQLLWLHESEGIATDLAQAAKADFIASRLNPNATYYDRPNRYSNGLLCSIALARVELLFQREQATEAGEELCTLVRVLGLFTEPTGFNDGYEMMRLTESVADNLDRIACSQKLSIEAIERLLAKWPTPTNLFLKMLESELVLTCWEAESTIPGTEYEGWFGWSSRTLNASKGADFGWDGNAFWGIASRRSLTNKIRHLQQCIDHVLSGRDRTRLPAPPAVKSMPWPYPINYGHVYDCRSHDSVLSHCEKLSDFHRVVLELRRLEFNGPLSKQKESATTLAKVGTQIRFEDEDCIVSFEAGAFREPGFDGPVGSYRLKPLK